MTPQLAAPKTISRVDIFRRRALKIRRQIPRSAAAIGRQLDREGRRRQTQGDRPGWRMDS
jgi:hypothetical protein